MRDNIVVNSRRSAVVRPSPTMRDVMAVLFRQRRVAMASFVVVLAATALYWFVTPAYQARMTILLRRERVDPVVTSEANGPIQLAHGEVSEEDLNSEVTLLKDEGLLRKVVEANALEKSGLLGRLGLSENDHAHRVARGVRTLAQRVRVDPVRKTNLIAVSYNAADPARAAAILNSLANLYVEMHAEVHRPSGQFPFFAQQSSESRQRLAIAENRLTEFTQNEGVVAGALERDIALQHASDLESSYRQTRVARAETERRIGALKTTLASLPTRSTTTIKAADNSQLFQVLKARLLELQLKRTELLKVYEPTYRLVREVDEQIGQAQAAIAAENEAPLREETTEKDPNYEWAKAELEKAQVEDSALRGREGRTEWELSQSWERAQRLGESAIRQQDLLRNLKTAEEAYLLYARKSEEARIGDALDERGILNVAIVEAPRAPVLPVHAGWVIAFVGLVVSTGVSAGLAFLADVLDPALRTPDEVVACLDVPVLASLPREAA
jgi:uncharacterized protein involved in exopolysaccharide biosynthesis